jgi:hypothetical protein
VRRLKRDVLALIEERRGSYGRSASPEALPVAGVPEQGWERSKDKERNAVGYHAIGREP